MALTKPIQRLGEKSADLALKYIPDPYVLVIILTVFALVGTLGVGASVQESFNAWYDGVWTFLEFMAQFAIVLMTGDAIAKSPAVTKLLKRIADFPSSQRGAVAFVVVVSMIAGLLSWGLGLVVGAVMARQVAYQGKKNGLMLHYPLLVAAGYTALMVWHSGLTTSSGLLMATPSSLPESFTQYTPNGIPLSQTIGSTVNLVTIALLLLVVPPVMAALHPDDDDKIRQLPTRIAEQMAPETDSGTEHTNDGVAGTDPARAIQSDGGVDSVDDRTGSAGTVDAEPDPIEPGASARETPADRLNKSAIFTALIAVFPAYYFVNAWFIEGSGFTSLSINSVNAFFLFFAIVLWRTPAGIVEQMEESVENVAGIIFQFPFYAGISGMLTGTALGTVIANAFANIATPLTWPVLGLVSAGIVNIFVPSGGGQWVAQGPILLETTQQLGMPLYTAVVIEMMGDQLTNMIQPFWALPLLALADLRARDIIGYSAVAMVAGFVVMATTMTVILGLGIGA